MLHVVQWSVQPRHVVAWFLPEWHLVADQHGGTNVALFAILSRLPLQRAARIVQIEFEAPFQAAFGHAGGGLQALVRPVGHGLEVGFGFNVGAFVVVVHVGERLGAELPVAVAAYLHGAAAWQAVAVRGGPTTKRQQLTSLLLDPQRRNAYDGTSDGVKVEEPYCGVCRDKRS